jgi:esterase/lipase superfamily enzyme
MKQRTRGRTVPTELAALAAGVSAATIRKWASRGKLTRYGSRNKAEYSLDELREILRENAARIES